MRRIFFACKEFLRNAKIILRMRRISSQCEEFSDRLLAIIAKNDHLVETVIFLDFFAKNPDSRNSAEYPSRRRRE
jgi:hypothetical protein